MLFRSGALLNLAAAPAPPGTAAFGPRAGDALTARIDALVAGPTPIGPIPLRTGALTLLGSLAMTALALCAVPLAVALGL